MVSGCSVITINYQYRQQQFRCGEILIILSHSILFFRLYIHI